MKEIPLTKGKVALVDDDDFERLAQFPWHLHSAGYAARFEAGTRRCVYMHREIMGAAAGEVVDHVNGDKLDNRRSTNLRKASHSNNHANIPAPAHNTSGYKGVSWHKAAGKWEASIVINRKKKYLGCHVTAELAAAAYDRAAKEAFGEFALLNLEGK